jgi:hypothetical protein
MELLVRLLTIVIPLVAWVLLPAALLYLAVRLVRAMERRASSADEAFHLAQRTAEEVARLSLQVSALERRTPPTTGPSAV